MMITRKELHEAEMRLVNLCEDKEITRENIIEEFTNLMGGGE